MFSCPSVENGRWGFIDKSAHVRIASQFEDVIEINNTFDGDLEPVKKGKASVTVSLESMANFVRVVIPTDDAVVFV